VPQNADANSDTHETLPAHRLKPESTTKSRSPFANNSSHSKQDNDKNHMTTRNCWFTNSRRLKSDFHSGPQQSLSVLDEDCAEQRQRVVKLIRNSIESQARPCTKAPHLSLPVSRKMSRNPTGATSTETAFKSCARFNHRFGVLAGKHAESVARRLDSFNSGIRTPAQTAQTGNTRSILR